METKSLVDNLTGVGLGIGFAFFLMFGYYLTQGRTEWGFFYISLILYVIFIIYWAIHIQRKI